MAKQKKKSQTMYVVLPDNVATKVRKIAEETSLSLSATIKMLVTRQVRYREWKAKGKPRRKPKVATTKPDTADMWEENVGVVWEQPEDEKRNSEDEIDWDEYYEQIED